MSGTFANGTEIISYGNRFIGEASTLQSKIAEFDTAVQNLKTVWSGDSVDALEAACNTFKVEILDPFRSMLDSKGQAMVVVGNQFISDEEERVSMSSNI